MFNLTVETAHTFYVGEQGWLVHNCDPIIAGTKGLDHSFDKHAFEWLGMESPAGDGAAAFRQSYFSKWQSMIERTAQSSWKFEWSTGKDATTAQLARIDGKWFAIQTYKYGDRAGELPTAFGPSPDVLAAKWLAGVDYCIKRLTLSLTDTEQPALRKRLTAAAVLPCERKRYLALWHSLQGQTP